MKQLLNSICGRFDSKYALLAAAVAISGCVAVTSQRTAAESEPVVSSGEAIVVARPSSADDSAMVAATVVEFHRALATGDSAAALALLDDDVVVLESGGIETREQYRSHHLASDVAFARAVPSVRGPLHVRIEQDVAWAWSSSTTTGAYRGRPVNSQGAELVVVVQRPLGWRIAAIHWSSRQRR